MGRKIHKPTIFAQHREIVDRKIITLHDLGYGATEIAKFAHVSRSSVYRALRRKAQDRT